MVGVTGGEVKGQVTAPGQRGPTYLAKLGVDKQLAQRPPRSASPAPCTRRIARSSNTLTSGDRAGSRYYDVLENTDVDRDRERLVAARSSPA